MKKALKIGIMGIEGRCFWTMHFVKLPLAQAAGHYSPRNK